MNIGILSVSDQIYSTKRLYEEALKRGHEVAIINHLECSIVLSGGRKKILYEGEDIIDEFDVIIPRIGASVTTQGAAIVKEFELNEVFSTARSLGIWRSQNKLRTLQLLNSKQLPIPDTLFSATPINLKSQLKALGGPPVIIKLQEGTHGMGVMLAETEKSASSIIDTLHTMNSSYLLQEFIEESKSEDIRAFVVGGKVVAAMKRKGTDDDFRSNLHRGGTAVAIKISAKEEAMAVKAAHYLGLPVAGVDMIRSKKGSLIIEVNSTPGLQGIEAYARVNVAAAIIKFLESKWKSKPIKTKK